MCCFNRARLIRALGRPNPASILEREAPESPCGIPEEWAHILSRFAVVSARGIYPACDPELLMGNMRQAISLLTKPLGPDYRGI
ncbi:hypothetical protein AAFF_G00233920 [Aldrovandia affinis]|uniref:Uncharacterized protein n=1 Tax=Aldrovandia affinis TaxID=143900 RepID=A0AAD7REW7_9TELE|nr:hypothetical protein AAFF_G00233920 [Aldrovandia affinis]